jgi:tripartite-type tricarboxylate transporter receptor subunit TctC
VYRTLSPRRISRVLFAAAIATLASLAAAQSGDVIRMIVPQAAGSTGDTVIRAMSPELGKALGHPVVVEDMPGAGGTLGTAQLVRAPKDGSTLAIISSNHVINPSVLKSMPFDPIHDVAPITVFATVPLLLAVNTNVPAKNVRELIALMKSKPGQLNYGSVGNGTVLHLAMEMFKDQSGTSGVHVPYRGTGPLVSDLLGGQIDMAFLSLSSAVPQVKAGKLRAIAISTTVRAAVLPDVPTVAESGLPEYSFDAWLALAAPAGTSRSVIQNVYEKVRSVLAVKEVQVSIAAQGVTILDPVPPDQAPAFFERELIKHAKLVKLSGMTPE